MKQIRQLENHDFTNIHWGQEFTIEFPCEDIKGSIIGQGAIRSGDRIILCVQCRVDEVDYYIDTPELWQARIAFEKPISLETVVPYKMLKFLRSLINKPMNFFNMFLYS